MKVPIFAHGFNDTLKIIRNGNVEYHKLPVKPFLYSTQPTLKTFSNHKVIPEERILLSTKQKTTVYKLEFDTIKEFYNFKQAYPNFVMFAVGYLQQCYLSKPDLFLKYPNDRPLRVLSFDIECRTKGDGFADANRHEILAIGCSAIYYDESASGKESKLRNNHYKVFSTRKMNEKQMLQAFIMFYEEFNPDIVTGYNVKRFDIPYLVTRMRLNDLSDNIFNRGSNRPIDLSLVEENWQGNKTDINLPLDFYGRSLYDLYVQCGRDNKLRKLRDLKLSTVCNFFGIKDIDIGKEVKGNLHKFVEENSNGWDLLLEYLENDVYQNNQIFEIYFPGRMDLAEILKVPLSTVLNDYPTFVSDVFVGREMYALGYLGDKTNKEKYPQIQKYQGAVVDFNDKVVNDD